MERKVVCKVLTIHIERHMGFVCAKESVLHIGLVESHVEQV